MQLTHLLADQPGLLSVVGDPNVAISHIVSDSRQATPGALFVAYRGVGTDIHRFIPAAIGRGAAAIVGEQPPPPGLPVPYAQVHDGRVALAWLSATWERHPSRDMALVGITGTDGKTTTANLLHSILVAAGRRVGLISTVNAVIGDQVYDTGLHTTTPDAPDIQRYLARMRDASAEIAVLETTSHGLAQHRVAGCAFDVAVITNITHEHLDFHGSYEAYRDAKAMLFRALGEQKPGFSEKPGFSGLPKTAVLNRDDSSFAYLAAIPAERVITYGVAGEQGGWGDREMGGWGVDQRPAVHLMARNIRHAPTGTQFDVEVSSSTNSPTHHATNLPMPIVTPLVGRFNIANILAATGAALALGVPPPALQTGVRGLTGVPGRMERIDRGQAFAAIVDFAHTPNALARALETARELAAPDGRVIVVFGSAGLRDRDKRHLMGEVAAHLADLSIVTAEDPRTEALDQILAEIAAPLLAAGRQEGRDFVLLPDRQRAILYAVTQARPGDVVIVCGKGHEQSMCFGTIEHPWQDQAALRWALDVRQARATADPPFLLPTWRV